jgi:hypothetical protein
MNDDHTKPRWRTPMGIFMLAAGALGLYYLLTEHLTHFSQALPYLVLLACPLMHLFGHHHGGAGHAAHQEHKGRTEDDKQM